MCFGVVFDVSGNWKTDILYYILYNCAVALTQIRWLSVLRSFPYHYSVGERRSREANGSAKQRQTPLSGSRPLSGPLFPRRESESAVSVGCGFSETRPAEQRVAAVPSIAADLRLWLAFARARRDSDYSELLDTNSPLFIS